MATKSTSPTKKALLLSAYDTSSHKHWRHILSSNLNEYDWTVLTLAPRNFNWRIRSNALSWYCNNLPTLQQNYDTVLATSMIDLATLRGLVPELSKVKTSLYFHENQFFYPVNPGQTTTVEPKITQIFSALCANQLIFNSYFNQATFLRGVELFLKTMPDKWPRHLHQTLKDKSCVIPVPINQIINGGQETIQEIDNDKGLAQKAYAKPTKEKNSIVWNHRWEYDKGPDLLLAFLRECAKRQLDIRLYILGERFRDIPSAMQSILKDFSNTVIHSDFIPSKSEYLNLLARCEIAVSTAHHEFQGLSMLEAVAHGCTPLVPDHLVYAEHFPNWGYQYADDLEITATAMTVRLIELRAMLETKPHTSQTIREQVNQQFSWQHLGPKYAAIL